MSSSSAGTVETLVFEARRSLGEHLEGAEG